MESTPLRFEPRRLDDPLVVELIGRYFEEISTSIVGFDPALATPPEVTDFDPPAGRFLVGFDNGEPVACGGLRRFSEGVGEIRRMWVSPTTRGRGYGGLLLEAIEQAARAAGYTTVILDTNGTLHSAIALYRRAGYQEIARYNDNPFAQHFFKKILV